MTMKLKANKYRVKFSAPNVAKQQAKDDAQKVTQTPSSPSDAPNEDDILAIQQEGLTARQLRMARRVAQKHGLAFSTDYEAVKLLRDKNIDPFDRGNLLDLAVQADSSNQQVQLPQKISTDTLPTKVDPSATSGQDRAQEIIQLQREMVRRRRRNSLLLFVRIFAFVILPTLFAGYYFTKVATPMYSTTSAFQIITSDELGGGAGGVGGLLSGTQFANTPDAIAVQTYLVSKDAMLRLDKDVGFKTHFSSQDIDWLQRLDPNPTNEQAHSVYKKRVKIGFDPTEGVVRLEVIAADPQVSVDFSRALISYAEERVDGLSQRKRENQVADARRLYEEAVQERRGAQEALINLQQASILDPEAFATSLRSQISTLSQDLTAKEIQLQALLDNEKPNQSRVSGVRADIDRLKAAITKLEQTMSAPLENGMTLAELVSRIRMAQTDIASRDMMMQTSLEQLRVTETQATSQSRYLTLAEEPVTPDDPIYPRAVEDTILAFLIFSGLYLMVSITASILREQMG